MHAHPLTDPSPDLINIVDRMVVGDAINFADAVSIDDKMKQDFTKNLPDGFHSSIAGRVKTMETMKRGVRLGVKMIYDMEALFSQLLITGQNWDISLASVFEF